MIRTERLSCEGRPVHKYRVRLWMTDGTVTEWERYGETMESCLASAKRAARREFTLEEWTGRIAICGTGSKSVCILYTTATRCREK